MKTALLLITVAWRCAAQQPYYTESFGTPSGANWYMVGSIANNGQGLGVDGYGNGGGSLVSKAPVPGGTSNYVVETTGSIYNPGTYGGWSVLLRSDAGASSYYDVSVGISINDSGFCSASVSVSRMVSGSYTMLASAGAGCGYYYAPYGSSQWSLFWGERKLRASIGVDQTIRAYFNDVQLLAVVDNTLSSGQPGIAGATTADAGIVSVALT